MMDHIVETNKRFKGIAWSTTYIEDNVLGTAAMVFIECVYSKRLALLPLMRPKSWALKKSGSNLM